MNETPGTSSPESADALAELEALYPIPAKVEIAGETIEVWPLKVRQRAAFHRATRGLAFAEQGGELLLDANADELMAAVAIALDREQEWVGDLAWDDFLRLLEAVLAVNARFFAERVKPATEAFSARLAGLMRFSGSSNTVTTPVPSANTP